MAAPSPEEQQKILAQFQGLKEELDALYSKLSVVDGDRSEHELVIKQMGQLNGERRCWQQIGPVLAEKKVKDVLPTLSTNKDQLVAAMKALTETIEDRERRLAQLQQKYNIRERTA